MRLRSNLYGVAKVAAPPPLAPGGRVPTPVRRVHREWMDEAACRPQRPSIWEDAVTVPLARHICATHCQVVQECAKWASDKGWHESVVGGQLWLSGGHNRAARPRALPPADVGLRPDCPLCETPEVCTPFSKTLKKRRSALSRHTRAIPGGAALI